MFPALALMLQIGATAEGGFDLARHGAAEARPAPMTIVARRCGAGDDSEVVVCARGADRYRLPLPVERPLSDRRGGMSAMAAITPGGRCGVFAGERRCGKAEAAEYGYGQGRDPITAIGRIAGAVLDPE